MNLFLLLLLPLLSALLVLLVPGKTAIRWTALSGAVAQWLLTLLLYAQYRQWAPSHPGSRFYGEAHYPFMQSWHLQWHMGVDGISVAMILLTSFVVTAGVLMSWKVEKMTREFYFLLLLLSFGAYGFFISMNVLMLFFFLEIAVIPKYLLIGIWGSGRKEYSANKLALMLMGGSALVLVGMLAMYFNGGKTFDLLQLAQQHFSRDTQLIAFPLLFAGFGIFTALFPFHTWVPDGHSSAPTAGSMFLAGISMKLGGYGCLRVATFLMPEAAKYYAPVVLVLAATGILYGAFTTMMQKDLKYINAYSSVSHCGFVLLGLGMLNQTALTGAVLQMVSHGVMTALFFAVIGMMYERTHTRQVAEMGGLLKRMPFIISVFFLVGLCSLGLPGLSGFVAEMTVFVGAWQHPDLLHRITALAACMSIVVTAVYILRAIGRTAMGPLPETHQQVTDASWPEKTAAILLVAGILLIGLYPSWLNELVAPDTAYIIQKIQVLP